MKFLPLVLVSCLTASIVLPFGLHAETSNKRDTSALLFENPDWAQAPSGSAISYDYARKTYGSQTFGASFDDTIGLTLEPGENPQSRKVDVRMFSGAHRHAAGPFPSMSTNPVLLLVFEDHVQELSRLFKANPRYLKNAIRKAWREAATIEDVQLSVGGKTIAGTRITTRPFVNDPKKDLMQGLDELTYVIEIADSVPGEIVTIDIHAPKDGVPIFSESLHYHVEKTP